MPLTGPQQRSMSIYSDLSMNDLSVSPLPHWRQRAPINLLLRTNQYRYYIIRHTVLRERATWGSSREGDGGLGHVHALAAAELVPVHVPRTVM